VVALRAKKHVFGAVGDAGTRAAFAGPAFRALAAAGLRSGVRSELRRAPRAPRPLDRAGRLRLRERLAVALAGPRAGGAGRWRPQGHGWQQQQPGRQRFHLLRARPGSGRGWVI
jgi:hypothetical protein